MGIVDYLSHDPFNDPWPESELDEKFVVATINSFHEALACMSSRLKGIGSLDRNENLLECSRRNAEKQSSSTGCHGNQNGQKLTRLDRNERKQFSRLPKQLNTTVQGKAITFSSTQLSKQSCSNKLKFTEKTVSKNQKKIEKTDLRNEMSENFNRSYDWWLGTPQDWRNDDREESLLDPKWNRSMTNANELSDKEEITETLQRTRKIIRGGRKNRDSSDSETRHSSRVKWQLEPEQQREADQRLLSFWQIIGGESNIPGSINRELVANTEENNDSPGNGRSSTIIQPTAPVERKLSEVKVIEVDLTTTEDFESEVEACAIEPPKPSSKSKLQMQQHLIKVC